MCVCTYTCIYYIMYVSGVVHILDPFIHTEVHSMQCLFVGADAYLV